MKFVLASHNAHKAIEIKQILGPDFEILTMGEAGFTKEITEDGKTFEENAVKKAETVMKETGLAAIADDSGLCVEALGGAPGVYTARYAGEGASDDDNIDKLLCALKNVPEEERKAEFVSCIAFASPGMDTKTFTGKCSGHILFKRAGENGFGYDPIFYTPIFGKSLAEITAAEKNSISHRSCALKLFKEYIKNEYLK